MKPTDEERMEVARRLRDFSEFVYEGRYYHLNGTLLGMGLYATTLESLRVGMCRLADLIEPEPERTCRMEVYTDTIQAFDHDEQVDFYECGGCGSCLARVGEEESIPNYCPNCGAKVADER